MSLRRLIALALCLSVALIAACDREEAAETTHEGEHYLDMPAFEFLDPQEPLHPNWLDMGLIDVGEIREATVRMRNVEGRAITFESVQAGCSCTLPRLSCVTESGERIEGDMRSRTAVLTAPPNSVIELVLRVDAAAAPVKNKDKIVIVRMTTDSPSTPYVSIEVRMKIFAPLQPIPPNLSLDHVGMFAGGEAYTDITPFQPTGNRVVDVLSAPDGVLATLEERELDGIPVWRLHARLLPPIAPGYREDAIVLSTTGVNGEGEGAPLSVKIRWTGVPDVELIPAHMMFTRPSPGAPEQASAEIISHMPGQKLLVTGHSISAEDAERFDVRVEPIGADDAGRATRWSLIVRAREELQGPLTGVVTLELDDPQFPRIEAPYTRRK